MAVCRIVHTVGRGLAPAGGTHYINYHFSARTHGVTYSPEHFPIFQLVLRGGSKPPPYGLICSSN